MSFSNIYSAIVRGKWFIDYRMIDSHRMILDQFLNKTDEKKADATILSERKPLMAFVGSGKSMAHSNKFADAPAGSIAVIPLAGTMLKHGTYCSYGTEEVAAMVDQAAESSKIAGIVLNIDSGGGAVDAIAPMVEAIQGAQAKGKPVVACCDLCASAAYYTAIYCDEIVAANSISSEFGSIGVMMSFMDYAKYYEEQGVKEHTVYSNLSTYKNAAFEAARKGEYDKLKEEELDPLARQFQAAVKSRRGGKLNLSTEGIIAGRMFYADSAKENGLIDSVGNLEFAVNRTKDIRRDAEIGEYINSKN